jgi:hypothetical protein
MPYVNDAQTLADVVGPASAADALQTQQAQAQQEMAIKNQVAAGQAPADIQRPGLQNALTQAQTYGQQGLGLQANAKGLADMYAAPSAAQAQVAGNQASMTADQAKKIGSLGQLAGQVAGQMDNVPPPARQAAMAQILQANNIDPSQLGPLASGDPDMLRQFSQKAIQASSDFQTKMAVGQQEITGRENIASTEASSRQGVADTLSQGRQAVAQTNAAVREKMAPVQAIVGQLTAKAAAGTATPQELAILKWAQDSQQLIKNGNPFQSGITGTNTQSNVPDVPNVGGNQTPQTPAAAAPDQNAIEAEMKRRGLIK